jgi:hypothetical protein
LQCPASACVHHHQKSIAPNTHQSPTSIIPNSSNRFLDTAAPEEAAELELDAVDDAAATVVAAVAIVVLEPPSPDTTVATTIV